MKKTLLQYCFLLPLTLLLVILSWLPETGHAEKTVVDQLGRTVILPDHPRRIVSLAPSITEMVFILDQGHRLVGATQFSDYPEAATRLPKVGSYVRLDIEKIVSLSPDLCIATKDGNPLEVIQVLEGLDIPVYAVDPRNLKTVMDTILEIGGLLDAGVDATVDAGVDTAVDAKLDVNVDAAEKMNVKDKARAVTEQMEARIRHVVSRVGNVKTRPRVFYQIGISPIVSAGTRTCIHELIEMAGGVNIAGGPVPYPRFSFEQVLGLAPDILIITSMAKGAVFENVKNEWRRWPEIPAVKNGRILLVNSDILDRPTPRLVQGLEMLATIIHPDLFEETP